MTQDLSDLKLEEWERIAREATPGPWTKEISVYSNGSLDAHFAVRTVDKLPDHPWSPRFITFMTGTLRSDLRVNDIKGAKYCRECEAWHLGWSREIGVDVRADAKAEADATFIATFDPPTVLSLLSALKEAREALRPFAKIAGHLTSCAYGPAWGFNGGVVEHEDFLKARKAFTTLGGSEHER